MGVTSAGHGYGSTFYFELPLFGPDQTHRRELSRRPEFTPTPRRTRLSGIVCGDDSTQDIENSGSQTVTSSPSVDSSARLGQRAVIPPPFPGVFSAQDSAQSTSYTLLECGESGPRTAINGGLFIGSRSAPPRDRLRLLIVVS